MKKTVLAATLMAFGLAACGEDDGGTTGTPVPAAWTQSCLEAMKGEKTLSERGAKICSCAGTKLTASKISEEQKKILFATKFRIKEPPTGLTDESKKIYAEIMTECVRN